MRIEKVLKFSLAENTYITKQEKLTQQYDNSIKT